MNPCLVCGGQVRLGAHRVSFNRQRGIHHYIAHMRSTDCKATEGYSCTMFKPYPKPPPREEMVARWNSANRTPGD